MISKEECKNYEENLNFEEPETTKKKNKVDKINEIMEHEIIYDIFPTYDLQDEELTQCILGFFKILFWGVSAIVSTLLWLYFFNT